MSNESNTPTTDGNTNVLQQYQKQKHTPKTHLDHLIESRAPQGLFVEHQVQGKEQHQEAMAHVAKHHSKQEGKRDNGEDLRETKLESITACHVAQNVVARCWVWLDDEPAGIAQSGTLTAGFASLYRAIPYASTISWKQLVTFEVAKYVGGISYVTSG